MRNIIIGVIILAALFLLFSLISSEDNPSPQSEDYSTSTYTDNETYEEDSPSEEYEAADSLEFNGYECTVDCSGHEAGYEWAAEHGITQDDVDNYSGNSNSFMEGMQSYVDEN